MHSAFLVISFMLYFCGLGTVCATGLLFQEFSLEMEPEEDDEPEHVEKSEADEMAEYEKIAGALKAKETGQLSTEELEQAVGKSNEDAKFLEFQRIIAKDPEQASILFAHRSLFHDRHVCLPDHCPATSGKTGSAVNSSQL